MTTPCCARLNIWLKCVLDSGVSRGTIIKGRFSLIMTSAARSNKLSLMPKAMAAKEPMLHGQTTIASGGFEPDAMGANHASRPKTLSCPSCAPVRSTNQASAALGLLGKASCISWLATTCAACEYTT